MQNLAKVLSTKTKIRFQDCDPFNHLNNGCYINYFMNHREDALIENYNLDIYSIAKNEGRSWVSSSNQIAYLKPVLLMETVIIESQLVKYNNSELHVEMRMFNEDKSQLKAIIWSGFVHYNLLKQKREIHSENFMELFNSVLNPVKAHTFDERLNQLKTNHLIKT